MIQPEADTSGLGRFARLRDYAGRGVVTTCTYEARALGVSSGMGLMKAALLAPEAVLLPADFEAYRYYSCKFKAAVAKIAPQIENRGIDEIYIDLTELPEDTFERDLHPRLDREALSEIFTQLCTRVAGDLQRQGYSSRTIGIKLRFDDFRTVTRDLSLPTPTADPAVIRRAAGVCLKRVAMNRRLRLLGVRASTLQANDTTGQADLPL